MVEPDPKICSDPCRFDIFLVALDPTKGSEIKKTRPCVIISPDEMNHSLSTILVAPMTTTLRSYPTRVFLTFNDKKGQIALDQMRTLERLLHKAVIFDGDRNLKMFKAILGNSFGRIF